MWTVENRARYYDRSRLRCPSGEASGPVHGSFAHWAVQWTGGAFHSADFDLIVAAEERFHEILLQYGFCPEDRAGKLKVGYYHPDYPQFGWQLVTGPMFDGRADTQPTTSLSGSRSLIRFRGHGMADFVGFQTVRLRRSGAENRTSSPQSVLGP